MHTRTLVVLGALVVLGSAGVVSLSDGSSDRLDDARRANRAERSASTQAPASPAGPVGPGGVDAAPRPVEPSPGPVRVVGLQINSAVNTGGAPGSDDAFGVDLAFFGTFERTRLACELFLEDGGMLGIDDERSSLEAFHDDRGSDLLKRDSAFGPFEMMPRISDDGRYLVFVIPSEEQPADDATRLHAEGTIAVQTAREAATFTGTEVALKPGSTFSAGGFEFEVTEVGKSDWTDKFQVTLKTRRDTVAILAWDLVDEAGAVLTGEPSMSMSGMGTWHQTLDFERLPDRGSFSLEVWQDLATVEVPFALEAGVGLR